jgi:hypothetical protein
MSPRACLSILPVLNVVGQSYRPLVIKQAYIAMEPELFTRAMLYDELSSVLAIICAIPDDLRLWSFPSHLEGPDCWCRPQVTFTVDALIVNHKDLNKGEFDC